MFSQNETKSSFYFLSSHLLTAANCIPYNEFGHVSLCRHSEALLDLAIVSEQSIKGT